MKIQFSGNQPYQLDAIQAAVDLFEGQPLAGGAFEFRYESLTGLALTEFGCGNQVVLSPEAILRNLQAVQQRNLIENSDKLESMDFSVEMETGTGKTYVYLRTLYDLHLRYGFSKFVIVVPSVAIREGVLSSIRLTREHFQVLYGNVPVDAWVYDSAQVSRLRQFAGSNHMQVLVMNIDAFNKKDIAVIHNDRDSMSGRKPIEFIQSTRPIVIIDEPQNMESEKAKEAIASLNPLCTLRYSATHRNLYHQIYRLDPVRAYDLRLVKRLEVASIVDMPEFSRPYIALKAINTGKSLTAKIEIDVTWDKAAERKTITARHGQDLFELSNEREVYRGYIIQNIDAGLKKIEFANGVEVQVGEQSGANADALMRTQIRETVREHFEKELRVLSLPEGQRLKVLSLFFIDRVADYAAEDGKIRRWFAEAYGETRASPRYAKLPALAVEAVHNGYFAQDKGKPKDTSGATKADDDAYELIMRDKERLLSLEEPLRFIFSHSALREGWDNPNVFQICTLNETKSPMRKRQEIGRGLRLPVDQNGQRVFDESVNKLLVMANESYEDFARALQSEYEEDCGVTFGKVPLTAIARIARVVDGEEQPIGREAAERIRAALVQQKMLDGDGRIQAAFDPRKPGFRIELPEGEGDLAPAVIDLLASYQIERHIRKDQDEGPNRLKKQVQISPEFKALWDRIKPKTMYRVEFETETLVRRAVDALKRMETIETPKIRVSIGQLDVKRGGIAATAMSIAEERVSAGSYPVP